MKYLFKVFCGIEEQIISKHLLLLLDFDGTLAPIAATPEKAALPPRTRALLADCAALPDCRVAVISGRSLEDVKSKVGLNGVIYSGNHGFQLEGPQIRFDNPLPKQFLSLLKNVCGELREELSDIKGVLIEDKTYSLSVHYRLVAGQRSVEKVKQSVQKLLAPYIIKGLLKLKEGKKVLEIRLPLEWDKGKIALWLVAREQYRVGNAPLLPIYIGDDITDEDAFSALDVLGLTVFVGRPRASAAKYYLTDTEEVVEFLKIIRQLKREANHG